MGGFNIDDSAGGGGHVYAICPPDLVVSTAQVNYLAALRGPDKFL
ncbi:MAG: hypothetical protein M0Z52_05850 [Actinomycetota bacterium]|nr:hypothetical protein [Nitrospiraceae bacterium]MDA8155961.1 hypothetical protein [Actinomycetota bacterium]